MLELKKFKFNGVEVDFEPTLKGKSVMVNATQMGMVFGKRPVEFLKSEQTQRFVEACLKSENLHYFGEENEEKLCTISADLHLLCIKKDKILAETDLYYAKKNSGTWMHEILALKFAAWLDPEFELWVFTTIRNILFGNAIKRKNLLTREIKVKKELKAKRVALIEKSQDYAEILELEDELKKMHGQKVKIAKDDLKQTELDFENF